MIMKSDSSATAMSPIKRQERDKRRKKCQQQNANSPGHDSPLDFHDFGSHEPFGVVLVRERVRMRNACVCAGDVGE